MKKIVRITLYAVCIAALCFAGTKLFKYYGQVHLSRSSVERLEKAAITESDGQLPIKVDFSALQEENPEIIAWLYSEGTPINYPVVQAEDNSKYLRSLTDGSYNSNGTLFLDYRSAGDFSDFFSIIYGHRMKSEEMFGTLPKYLEQDYYEQHPVMYLITPQADYKLELISCMTVSADDDIYGLAAADDEQKQAMLDRFAENSAFKSLFEYSAADDYLCLSTCSYEYNNARLVVICKLVKV